MKINEKKDLQTKTKIELIKLVQDAQALLVSLKLDHKQNKLKDTRSIFVTRKKIAILQTILNMKQAIALKTEEKPI